MRKPNYVILKQIEMPNSCFLWEVVQWRALGTFPEAEYDFEGRELREHPGAADLIRAPVPDGAKEHSYLTLSQTDAAGLPPDSSNLLLNYRIPIQDPVYFERQIEKLSKSEVCTDNQEELRRLQSELENVRTFLEQRDEFLELYEKHITPSRRKSFGTYNPVLWSPMDANCRCLILSSLEKLST